MYVCTYVCIIYVCMYVCICPWISRPGYDSKNKTTYVRSFFFSVIVVAHTRHWCRTIAVEVKVDWRSVIDLGRQGLCSSLGVGISLTAVRQGCPSSGNSAVNRHLQVSIFGLSAVVLQYTLFPSSVLLFPKRACKSGGVVPDHLALCAGRELRKVQRLQGHARHCVFVRRNNSNCICLLGYLSHVAQVAQRVCTCSLYE